MGLTTLPAAPAPSEPVAFGSEPELVARMNYLALTAAASGLLAELPPDAEADVRRDIGRLVARPGADSAPTPDQRAEIEARLGRLERIAAVVGSPDAVSRSQQLAAEYLAAQPAPPVGEAAAAPDVEAAISAAYVTMLAELEPDIRAARDAESPARPAASWQHPGGA